MRLSYVDIEREACRRSLSTFVREAWHVLEPGQPYKHGWHMDAMAEHLEAVTSGQITRLLINIPPGTSKSTMVSVMWPSWEWGPRAMPHMRFIGASHEQGLAVRDTLKMRRLVTSAWFQERWPLELRGDQNEKMFYENAATGFRQACAVKSMTGRRGDRVAWDDPHSVESALSPADRATALRVFQETLPTRLNNPDSSAIVIVMQRLHEDDVAGYALAQDLGYVHLCLPMEFEPERRCVTSIGWQDPRTEDGELLFPERFPREVVERDKKVMGTYAVAGQFQQRPAPRGDTFFETDRIEIVRAVPANIVQTVRYWDKAGTDTRAARGQGKRPVQAAWTAGVKMGVLSDGRFIILDVVRGQWAAPARERTIKQTAHLDGIETVIWIEQEPGSGGKESAENTITTTLPGYSTYAERPSGDKALRAEPLSVQVEAGNVLMLEGPWNADFLAEAKTFPVGKYKDQIDAAAGALNKLAVPQLLGVAIPDHIKRGR